MTWIRMDVTMKSDPSVHAIAAECCKGDVPKAIGHLQCLWSEFLAHARDGNLTHISSLTVEQWAMWRGKDGAFDAAVRQHLCVDEVTRSWDKHNGAAIRAADANREKQQRHRNRANNARARTASGAETGGESDEGHNPSNNPSRNPLRNGVTERNGTREEEERAGDPAPSSAAGCAESFADLAHRDAYLGARRSARNPDTFDAMLRSLADGSGAPRGRPLTWHQLGTAILQISGQPSPPPLSANVIGGYATKVPAAPIAPPLALVPGDDPGTVRKPDGALVWHPGCPEHDRPTAEQVATNGWRVAA